MHRVGGGAYWSSVEAVAAGQQAVAGLHGLRPQGLHLDQPREVIPRHGAQLHKVTHPHLHPTLSKACTHCEQVVHSSVVAFTHELLQSSRACLCNGGVRWYVHCVSFAVHVH